MFRITPAYAGTTSSQTIMVRINRDHPRIRGDNFIGIVCQSLLEGSPPHTRGQQHIQNFMNKISRITPAYAGTTYRKGYQDGRNQDHPRIRGDNPVKLLISPLERGSPPHTRGQPIERDIRMEEIRITPAYAGTTESREVSKAFEEDHPRIRGDNAYVATFSEYSLGSPPHTRGQQSFGFRP